MLLSMAVPVLEKAIKKANVDGCEQEIKFMYSDLHVLDKISSVFDWLIRNNIRFGTRYDKDRFVVIIYPKVTTEVKLGYMKIGDLLKTEITKKGYSQKDFAKAIGKSETSTSQMLTGVYQPSKNTLDVACGVLDIEIMFNVVEKS